MLFTKKALTEECYKKSTELLLNNSHKFGVMASSVSEEAKRKMYVNIFGRDASICSLGMVASRHEKLIKAAKNSLLTLAEYQSKLGEIPESVNPVQKKNYFYFLGSIDSTLWWLIALDFYDKNSGDKSLKIKLEDNIKKALRWLKCQDQNNDGLIEQGEASDWADDMPNNGRTLYSNALWYKVLDLYGLSKRKELALDGLNTLFLPHDANPKRSMFIKKDEHHRMLELNIIREFVDDIPYYLHYVSYKHASDRCDVYGNSLAILFGVASPLRSQAILRYMRNEKISRKYPVQILTPPIKQRDFDWRPNMDREECANKPFGYHNGGIWPYIGAFYVMALYKINRADLAEKELENLAKANSINDWEFNEWFHGKSGKPMGMRGQSWNAGAFLLAYHYLRGEIII